MEKGLSGLEQPVLGDVDDILHKFFIIHLPEEFGPLHQLPGLRQLVALVATDGKHVGALNDGALDGLVVLLFDNQAVLQVLHELSFLVEHSQCDKLRLDSPGDLRVSLAKGLDGMDSLLALELALLQDELDGILGQLERLHGSNT